MRLQLIAAALVVAVVCMAGFTAGCTTEKPAVAVGVSGCLAHACHARVEHAHYGGAPLQCTDCHGGDATRIDKATAHVTTSVTFKPRGPQERHLVNPSLADLDGLAPEVMRFLNPADYRVATATCGSATLVGGNCHTRIVASSILSTHASLAGQVSGGLFFAGFPPSAFFGVRDLTDVNPADIDGALASLHVLPDQPGSDAGAIAAAFYSSFSRSCLECHLNRRGTSDPGKYYSSGCNACHLVTDNDGRAHTDDATQDIEEVGHGARHRFTNQIPDAQCDHCHHAHVARGMLIQGVRERAEIGGDLAIGGRNPGTPDPPRVGYWPAANYERAGGGYTLYGKPYPFYIEDEDTSNQVDETPPDIHHEKQMACIDCHSMRESHGGGHLAVRRDFEVEVRCQTCHGEPGVVIDVAKSVLQRAGTRPGAVGDNPPIFAQEADGAITQRGKLDGAVHPVTQIARVLDEAHPRFNRRTRLGCGLHAGSATFRAELLARFNATPEANRAEAFPGMPAGAALAADLGARAGRLECFSCHNAWTTNCYGCHMVRDDRSMGVDVRTGAWERGAIQNLGMAVVADGLALGMNARGRISPMVGTSIFFTHIDEAGHKLLDAVPLPSGNGFAGEGQAHNPVHHHTIRKLPRNCEACHPLADANDRTNEVALKRATGVGTGEFLFVDGAGRKHVLDRLVRVEFEQDGVFEDPTRPLPLGQGAVRVTPLAGTTHLPLASGMPAHVPGPLDLDGINRMLRNRVVPQKR